MTGWLIAAVMCVTMALPAQEAGSDSPSPVRLEVGGYGNWADHDFGWWRGAQTQVWIRSNARFIPILTFDSQTRPEGTQQNFGFLSYLNWTRNFYTVQGVSGAPAGSREPMLFPRFRCDAKAFWKIPPARSLVAAAGITRIDYGHALRGEIYNLGSIYYRHRWVIEGNAFLNHSRPGDLWTASGLVSAQHGTEGKQWIGATAGGGRELYRLQGVPVAEFRFDSYTFTVFYRKWFSRHIGIYVAPEYQHKLGAFHRLGVTSRVFYEF